MHNDIKQATIGAIANIALKRAVSQMLSAAQLIQAVTQEAGIGTEELGDIQKELLRMIATIIDFGDAHRQKLLEKLEDIKAQTEAYKNN